MQRVALVVIQQKEACRREKIRQPAIDRSNPFRYLVRIGEIKLPPIFDARRMNRQLPSLDECSADRQRKENVGVPDVAMIKIILRPRSERIGVDCPPAQRNAHAKLRFCIPFAVQGFRPQVLAGHKLQHRPGHRDQRRSLVEMSVEPAKHPVPPEKWVWRMPALSVSQENAQNCSSANSASKLPSTFSRSRKSGLLKSLKITPNS